MARTTRTILTKLLSVLALVVMLLATLGNGTAHGQDQAPGHADLFGSISAAGDREPEARPMDPQAILATVRYDDYSFDFVDEGTGLGVGVAEIARPGKPSVLSVLTGQHQATALEVFLSLAPAKMAAPERLQADHREQVRLLKRAAAPRRFDLAELRLTVATPGHATASSAVENDTYLCYYNQAYAYDGPWAWDWYNTFGKYKDATGQQVYRHIDLSPYRLWSAGESRERWLSACHGFYSIYETNPSFQAQFYSNGAWHTAYSNQLEDYDQVLYWSNSLPQRWRVRMSSQGYGDYIGVAVAIMKPFGFTTSTGI
jgi:hypothetical protein